MTNKIFFITLFFLATTHLSAQKPAFFEVKGFVENNYSGTIFLYHYNEKGSLVSDKGSIADHRFYFKNKLGKPHKGYFVLAGTSSKAEIYIDTGTIQVSARIDSLMAGNTSVIDFVLTKITGSKSQSIWEEAMTFFNQYKPTDLDDPAITAQWFRKVSLLEKKYPDLDVTGDILFYVKEKLTHDQLKTLFANLSKRQQERATNYGIQKTLNRLQKLTGNDFIYFPAQTDTAGKKISLANLHYKYLLIDFWASNCGPCRQAHPGMIGLYNKYRSQGFELIGISLDKERSAWIQAIQQDKLPWKQVSDLKEFATDIVEHYSLSYIPFNILIDSKGKIIATELQGERLDKMIGELFRD